MALESIINGEMMGFFGLGKKKSKGKAGIAAAAGFAAAISGTSLPAHAQDYQQAIEMTPEIREQLNSGGIPPFLAHTMFARIPNSEDLIRVFNIKGGLRAPGITPDKISYIMDPTITSWYDRWESNNMADLQLGFDDIQKPEYWILLKLAYNQLDNPGNYYNIDYGRLKDRIENQGVLHLAKALHSNTINRGKVEEELLRALYIGATGNDNGVTPILNGSYVDMPDVQQKIEEWEDKGVLPFSDKNNNALMAYMTNTITHSKVQDSYLTSLSLILLNNNYYNINRDKNKIISIVENTLEHKNKIPSYTVTKESGTQILPFNLF